VVFRKSKLLRRGPQSDICQTFVQFTLTHARPSRTSAKNHPKRKSGTREHSSLLRFFGRHVHPTLRFTIRNSRDLNERADGDPPPTTAVHTRAISALFQGLHQPTEGTDNRMSNKLGEFLIASTATSESCTRSSRMNRNWAASMFGSFPTFWPVAISQKMKQRAGFSTLRKATDHRRRRGVLLKKQDPLRWPPREVLRFP